MKELITLIAKSLVKQPEAVSVTVTVKGDVEVYEVHVAPEDMGKVLESRAELLKQSELSQKQQLLKKTKKYPLILSKG
mgnify:CR=1 FL=1